MSEEPLAPRPIASAAASSRGFDAGAVDLSIVGALIARRWWLVAAITALALALAAAWVTVAPKTWRASTRVLLDPRDKQLVGADVGKFQYSAEVGWVETRAELVKSHGVLAAVVERENLAQDPEIAGTEAGALGPDALAARAVRGLAEMVLVERPKENNLVDVTVTARTPDKAARLSKAIADAFVTGLAQAKVDRLEQADTLLSRQVETMRQKMLAAEAKVEEYKRANGIAVTRGNLVDEETLRQLNEGLVAARQKAQEAKERWDKLKQVVQTGEVRFPAGLDGVGSSVLSRLKIEAAMAAKRRTEIEQDYGPLHPKARAAAAEIERDRTLMLEQVKSLLATAEMDYQLARAAEDNVRKNLDRAQARLADTGQATVALQELENEAQARRELYKSFVSRLEETMLQKTTQISDATVVSPAQVPPKPYSPRLVLVFGLALLGGLGAGLSAALLLGRRDVPALLAARERALTLAAAPPSEPQAGVASAPSAALVDPVAVAEPPPLEPAVEAPAEPRVEPVAPTADIVPLAPIAAAQEPAPIAAEPPPAAEAPPAATSAAPPSKPRRSPEPVHVRLALTPERIARLGGADAAGVAPIDAFVVAADGRTDVAGLAGLRRLADELGEAQPVRVLFADAVPAPVVAALVHGLARAEAVRGARPLVIDLAGEQATFDPAYDRAQPAARSRRRRQESGFDLRLDASGIAFARPTDDLVEAPPARRAAALAAFVETARRDHDAVLLHLGTAPAAADLFDAAEVADHVTLIVDETELSTRRLAGEIDVLRGLLPHFEAVLVLEVADGETSRHDERRRGRRA